MKTKKKVFICNDSSFLSSGYGVYGKELLTRLHNSGKYEVAELGCYADINNPKIKNIPWKFYPNAVVNSDPRIKEYKDNPINQFGNWRFNRAILDFKPHIVFDIRDYWMSAYQEISPLRRYFHWVIMPTVDSSPPKIDWLFTFANADIVVPYTDWAKKTLSKYNGSTINLFSKIANAGINPHDFFPIADKRALKEKYFDGKNPNVIGVVMRNQKRKLFAELMLVFRKYLDKLKDNNKIEEYNNSILYLHTSFPEENGWDLPALLLEYGIADKVYFTYFCKNCGSFFPSKFKNVVTNCKKCNDQGACFTNVSNSISTQDLNIVYNLFDIFIQYAICEGFGMPQVEAAACGLQIASVDYSAMSEIADSLNGIKIPLQKLFRELETNADRAYPDNDFTINMLYDFFINTSIDTRNSNSVNIRNKCIDKYTWDSVYKVWDECFESIDIDTKLDWSYNIKNETNHLSMTVPPNLNPRQFVEYVCLQIIKEPYLINTAPIQRLIKDIDGKIIAKNGVIQGFTYNDAIKALEYHLNNKIVCEDIRLKPELSKREDFLNVSN